MVLFHSFSNVCKITSMDIFDSSTFHVFHISTTLPVCTIHDASFHVLFDSYFLGGLAGNPNDLDKRCREGPAPYRR